MFQRLIALILMSLFLCSPTRGFAYTTVGDIFTDIFYEGVYKVFGPWEQEILNKKIGIRVESCDVQFASRFQEQQTETHNRPGLLLCVYEHLMQQMKYPEKAVDITAWVSFSSDKSRGLIPFKVSWKVKELPKKSVWDYLTFGYTFYDKLSEYIKRWKDTEITIESKVGPLPLSLFTPENGKLGLKYRALSKREFVSSDDGSTEAPSPQTRISKFVFYVKTSLPNEPIAQPCLKIQSLDVDQSRMCIQLQVYGIDKSQPVLSSVTETNWTVKAQKATPPPKTNMILHFVQLLAGQPMAAIDLSYDYHLRKAYNSNIRQIQMNTEINPDARLELPIEKLEGLE